MVRILAIASFAGAVLAQGLGPGLATSHPAAGAALAQAVGPAESAATVAAGDTVLTIHGPCSPSQKPVAPGAQDCTVALKRQQFEDLLKIVAPAGRVTASVKQSLARTYMDLLAFEIAARQSGTDKTPKFQETMEWLRLRTLADLYRRGLEGDSSMVSEDEIDEYYRRNLSQFEEVKLRRMLVPRDNFALADKPGFENQALEIVTKLRARAANGEDLDQLQKEAYTAAGFTAAPPATAVGNRRRAALSTEISADVFALRPGEVSNVEKEPYSFVVYKVDAKRTLPKELVREEISRLISKQKLETAIKSATGSVRADLNENYFGPAAEQ